MRFVNGSMDLMRDSTAPLYDMTPIKRDGFKGLYHSNAWFNHNMLFTQNANDAVAITRRKSQAENGAHLIYVHRYLTGKIRGQLDDLSLDRDPDSVFVMDKAKRIECIQFPAIVEGVFMPKWMIGFDHDLHSGLTQFPNHETIGRLLNSELSRIFESLTKFNALEFDQVERFIACVRMAMRTDHGDVDIRRKARDALMDMICEYIELHLRAPEIGVTQLLSEFGVSRASLYRMFDHYGGVRQYIHDRRLYRAVFEIAQHPLRRGDLTRISRKWGFSSDANFNRAVKRQFGVAPGSLVDASADADFGRLGDVRSRRLSIKAKPIRALRGQMDGPTLRPAPTLLNHAMN
ncbi:MAG: AraC family transcriptional regulator [Pseudomonadota bacterium]